VKKRRWIAAGVAAALVGALAIGLGAAQAKSSGSSVKGGTSQTVATCEAMHATMDPSSGGEGPAQCQAMHDQMDQMMSGTTGSNMMDGSNDQAGGSMASHHGSGSTRS
jgi:hypothetical protein